MLIDEFLKLSYRELEKITKIDKSNWSKYFNRKLSPSWETIHKASGSLNMSNADLMEAIEKKRAIVLKKSSVELINCTTVDTIHNKMLR